MCSNAPSCHLNCVLAAAMRADFHSPTGLCLYCSTTSGPDFPMILSIIGLISILILINLSNCGMFCWVCVFFRHYRTFSAFCYSCSTLHEVGWWHQIQNEQIFKQKKPFKFLHLICRLCTTFTSINIPIYC